MLDKIKIRLFLIACFCFCFASAFGQDQGIIVPKQSAKPVLPSQITNKSNTTTNKIKGKKDKTKNNTNTSNNSSTNKKPTTPTKTNPTTPKPKTNVAVVKHQEPQRPKKPTTGMVDGYEWVDLDLPSGTLWATQNVGSNSPEDYGFYFGWEQAYPFDPNGVESGTIGGGKWGDAATEYWGPNWETPDNDQLTELKRYCSFRWETLNGTHGARVIGRNGASIFLPAAGTLLNDCDIDKEEKGTYWSSTPEDKGLNREGYFLAITPKNQYLNWEYLNCGLSIRPVLAVELDLDDY